MLTTPHTPPPAPLDDFVGVTRCACQTSPTQLCAMAEAPSVDKTLTPHDAVVVWEELLPAQNKPYELGLKLELQPYDVKAIHSNNLSPKRYLFEVLIKFLQQAEPRPTWRVILVALKSPAVNLTALAKELETAHFPDPTASRNVVPGTTATNSTGGDDGEVKPKPSHLVTENDIRDEIMQLDKQFHKIKKSTREHLEKQNIPVKEVTDALTSLVTYEGEIHHKLFLRDNVKDLLGADDHSEVFVLMNFHWDYLNYHLLEVVIKRFDIAKIKEEMNSYKLVLQHFREKTTLTLFCNAHKRKPRKPQGFCELVAEFNWPNNEDVTLEVVEDFRKKYMDQYHLQDFAMMLDEVRPGSFIVTWLVPESIVEMLQFTPKVPTELLQESYVTELQVTGITVFQISVPSSSGYSTWNPTSCDAASERGGQNVQQEGSSACIDFKLLGKCENSECSLEHRDQSTGGSTVRDTVEIPDKCLIATAIERDFLRKLRQIAECSLNEADKNKVDIVVSRQDEHHLPEIVKEYEVLLSQLYPRGPGWCFISHDGLAQNPLLEFKEYGENIMPVGPGEPRELQDGYFELCISNKVDESKKRAECSPRLPERDTDTLHNVLDRLHGEGKFDPQDLQKHFDVKFIEDHKSHIKQILKDGLEWFKGKEKYLKLEGRFGKVLWKHIPKDIRDGNFSIEEFKDFCCSEHSKTFRPCIKSADTIREKFQKESALETFDIKFTLPRKRVRIDMRVKFEEGKPILILARKNETKALVFDVLNLHKSHDVRMSLGYYEVVKDDSEEHAVVEKVLKTTSLAEGDKDTIKLITKTDDWCVNFIRHKKRETYCHGDKYQVTLTEVSEFQLERERQQSTPVHIYPDNYRKSHFECEVHHCLWERAFGPLDHPTVEPEVERAIPHPWQPQHIMEDFEEFWENLDFINDTMGPSS